MPNPSTSIPCDEIEGRYFWLYHEKLAFDLGGYFETPFWTHLISRECHHEPAVRHAVFALTALYKSTESRIYTTKANDKHLDFALVHQSKAIVSLRKTLSNGPPNMRLALIASLLFGCFESFQGNWETAIQQIYSGQNILKCLQGGKSGKVAESLSTIEPELGLTLRRLKLQTLSFLAMSPMCKHPFTDSEDEELMEDMVDGFTTQKEAFTLAMSLATRVFLYLRRSARSTDVERLPVTRQRDCLIRSVEQWSKAYEPIFLEAFSKMDRRQFLLALQLRIHSWSFEIMIFTSLSKEEIIFDKFTERFRQIIFSSRCLLQKDQEIGGSDGLRAQGSMGLIMTLFYTATRCRDFLVRREAIALLREWPCMNGIWHSLQAAKVAAWIVSIEEKDCNSATFVPEEHRVRMNSLRMAFKDGRMTIECMQGTVDGGLELRKSDLL
jgi:hypothetical protein